MADRTHSHGLIREGLATGMLGAVAVALWFLLVDSLAGRPLHTPALLGAVVTGAADPALAADGDGRLGLAALYSLVHVVAFGLVGIAAVFLVHRAERSPSMVALLLMLFAAVEVAFTGFVALLEVNAIGDIAWYQVALGNVVAAVVMGWYLVRSHPAMTAGWRTLATDDGR
ncbi:hypothetical protein [Roseisolibacter sp. H3M3-2]|uniref:hypothetical protein n=1 Tax=Roseisolibacter sp. H3M3-2 TaxID=3031323 RepID=UPI0023DADDE6|nr:hypothetical protein [Roseisolibacter sp. H3M3-2]MDF1504743.1 hypothetical protein [Roseisolibacter sp. H3M3-2]